MRIAWLLPDLTLSGGAGIVIEHARQLTLHHDMPGTLVRTKPQTRPDWAYRGLDALETITLDEARGRRFDVAVATWWETALDLFEIDADRHAHFLQLLEDSDYPVGSPDRLGFAQIYGLPVRFITAAGWIRDTVERMQAGNPAFYVPSGMAKETFASPAAVEAVDGPLRVVIEGGVDMPRKGVAHALEAVSLMREPRRVTLVTPSAPEPPHPGVDEHVGAIPHAAMAQLFARHDVLLKLSRAEGMYGPPLEAFHMGCTCVTNPVTGHEEYVRHDHNALVVDWDDPVGTARALDLLARDRALLQRLREGALETARAWPDWETSSAQMADVMRALAAEPPPGPRPAGRRAGATAQAMIAGLELAEVGLGEERARHGETREKYLDLRTSPSVKVALKARRRADPLLSRIVSARRRPDR
ncbi:MAG: glycosyltransferase family 4 protein [Conexibacter sp.]|nr:glycosyltransferase family 4 protein [Conexibacter sp.]